MTSKPSSPSQPIHGPGLVSRFANFLTDRYLLTPPAQRGRRSIFIRQLDAGSCHDAELEITALTYPPYDLERFGFHLVASPRHADVLLITGPLTRSMAAAALATFRAMPQPRRVVTVGDGFLEENLFALSYACVSLPAEIAEARVAHVPGDPPSPQQILEVLLTLKTS